MVATDVISPLVPAPGAPKLPRHTPCDGKPSHDTRWRAITCRPRLWPDHQHVPRHMGGPKAMEGGSEALDVVHHVLRRGHQAAGPEKVSWLAVTLKNVRLNAGRENLMGGIPDMQWKKSRHAKEEIQTCNHVMPTCHLTSCAAWLSPEGPAGHFPRHTLSN